MESRWVVARSGAGTVIAKGHDGTLRIKMLHILVVVVVGT